MEETNSVQHGTDTLKQLNADGIPSWAKSMSFVLTGLVGFILALGLNLGDVVQRYMDSKNTIETTELSQNGQLQVNALTGLIESNKGLSQHVTDLILSINTLITENKKLNDTNAKLLTDNADIQQQILVLQAEIQRLTTENQDLKTRLELSGK